MAGSAAIGSRKLLRAGACALLVIAMLVGIRAHAEPARDVMRATVNLSDLETGRLLLRAGRLEHAHAFLEQTEPDSEEERIERLFLLGSIELRLGMPKKAAERFEAILALRPGLTRVRLELARAYHLAGLDDRARDSLRLSLADELPSSVEAAVEAFLDRIDAGRRTSVSFAVNVLPETRYPERESVLIGGVPFRLDEDARASSGTGLFLSGGASFTPRLRGPLRGVFAASAAAKVYERSSWNETTASGEVGVARLLDRGSVSGGVRLGRVWTGGDPERTTVGPWARIGWRPSNSTHLDVALNADRRRHDTTGARDGWRLAASPRLVYAGGTGSSFAIEPVIEKVSARGRHHASQLWGLGARVSRGLKKGLDVTLGASMHVKRHGGTDPLFGTRRVDRNHQVSVRLLYRSVRLLGFAPYFGYSLERNRSTIPIREYRTQGVVAGISRAL